MLDFTHDSSNVIDENEMLLSQFLTANTCS